MVLDIHSLVRGAAEAGLGQGTSTCAHSQRPYPAETLPGYHNCYLCRAQLLCKQL